MATDSSMSAAAATAAAAAAYAALQLSLANFRTEYQFGERVRVRGGRCENTCKL
jgi:hypothetical protein